MGLDTIQDRVATVQSAAYDRAGYDVSYLLCVKMADMAKRSHVKITGADYSRNMILECQLTVQCHTKNTKHVHERYIRACDTTTTPADRLNLAICLLVPVMIASVLLGLRSRSFSR